MENEKILTDEAPSAEDSFSEELESNEDYAEEVINSDLEELKREFPELSDTKDITEIHNPTRYAALRDLGLSPTEAYLATTPRVVRDNRSHLKGTPTATARRPVSAMTHREWQEARALFEDLSDSEIEKLYKRVTK